MIGFGMIVIIILVLILAYALFTYNRFVVLKNRINNAWSQIDVQLKRRFDLIPNLIETVKGYVKHEKETLTEITKARSLMQKANTIGKKAEAENMLEGALKSLFAVSENYPRLKANENFKLLQEELAGTENKIAYSRQFYNDTVMVYNTKRERFPDSLIASMFKFKEREFFKTAESERKPVKVKFN